MISQPCALCKGPTEKRAMSPGYVSNYCPKRGVYIAALDDREREPIHD